MERNNEMVYLSLSIPGHYTGRQKELSSDMMNNRRAPVDRLQAWIVSVGTHCYFAKKYFFSQIWFENSCH